MQISKIEQLNQETLLFTLKGFERPILATGREDKKLKN